MTASKAHENKGDHPPRPFLMRFVRECTSGDTIGGNKKPPSTLITEVRRETTDDR